MSHFTQLKTSIRNLSTLQNVLTKLDISWEKTTVPIRGYQNQNHTAQLIIPQRDSIDIGFAFNGNSYELVADKSFWQQKVSMELFRDRINQVYALELLNKELTTNGFTNISFVEAEQSTIDVVAQKWID